MFNSVVVLVLTGLVCGIFLAFASKVFFVKHDDKEEQVREHLSGANCGACGYAGCNALAKAVISGEASIDKCPALKTDDMKKIADILGMEAVEATKKKAYIRCFGGAGCSDRFDYYGPADCLSMSQYEGGVKDCVYGCVGGGTCVRACPFDAIIINKNKLAEVLYEKCTGCGVCVDVCPKNLIFIGGENLVNVRCLSEVKGGLQKQYCKTGCVGCKLCEKACEDDAIHVVNHLANIDYDKCISCHKCADVCPTGVILKL